jgi:tetratricopeptide (TPR) repeat protein
VIISLAIAAALAAAPDTSRMDPAVAEPLVRAMDAAAMQDDGATWAALGQRLLAHEFIEAAREAFARAEQTDPSDARWPHLAGYAAGLAGDQSAAIAAYQRAHELDATRMATALRLARLLEDEDPESAQAMYRSVPESAAASAGIGRIAAAAGDNDAAIAAFQDALSREPEANRIQYQLAMAYRAAGDRAAATTSLSRSGPVPPRIPDPLVETIAVYARNPDTYIDVAAYAIEYGNAEGALRALDSALLVDPSLAQAWSLRTRALLMIGDTGAARIALAELIARDAGDVPARLTRASLILALDGPDTLLTALAQLETEVLQPAARRSVAALRLAAGDAGRAAAMFAALAEDGGEHALADRYHQGLSLARAGDCVGAGAAFEAALELAPSEGPLMEAAARTWSTCAGVGPEKRTRALELATALVRARPGPMFGETLAMAAAANGDYRRAVLVQRQLLDLARQRNSSTVATISDNLQRYQRRRPAVRAWAPDDPVFDLID